MNSETETEDPLNIYPWFDENDNDFPYAELSKLRERAKKVLKYKVDLFKADDIHADINELIIENDVLQALLADHLYKLELLTIQKESSSPDSHFTRSPPAKTTLQLQTPTSQKRFLPSTEDSRAAKATPQTPTAQKRFLPSTEHSSATKATVIQLPLQDFQPQTPTARKRFLPSTEDSSAAKATPQTPTARKRFLPSTGSTEDSSTAKDTPLSLMPSKYFVPSTEDSSTGKATPQTPTARKRFLPSTEHSSATKATPQTLTARKHSVPSIEDSSAKKRQKIIATENENIIHRSNARVLTRSQLQSLCEVGQSVLSLIVDQKKMNDPYFPEAGADGLFFSKSWAEKLSKELAPSSFYRLLVPVLNAEGKGDCLLFFGIYSLRPITTADFRSKCRSLRAAIVKYLIEVHQSDKDTVLQSLLSGKTLPPVVSLKFVRFEQLNHVPRRAKVV